MYTKNYAILYCINEEKCKLEVKKKKKNATSYFLAGCIIGVRK